MPDIVLTCDDFIRSGFLKVESCCPYCHQDYGLFYSEDCIVVNLDDHNMIAILCCTSVKHIAKLIAEQWDITVKGKVFD